MSDYKDNVTLTRLVCPQYDHYCINLYVPMPDILSIQTKEEFHGYLISKVEALMAKGSACDE